MPPLDSGSLVHLHVAHPLGPQTGPRPELHASLGAYLQAEREHLGVGLADIAEETRIKLNHLQSIEADDWDALPSRPFAIGYVRAYAKALKLDPGPLVERLRREVPSRPVALQAPVGLAAPPDDRRPLIYVAVGLLFGAVVAWNVVQRVVQHADEAAPRPDLAPAVAAALPVEPAGPIKLSAPTPAPAEQSTPAPYVTPGLEAQTAPLLGAAQPAAGPDGGARKLAEGLVAAPASTRAFETRAAIYGEAPGRSNALLLARNPAALVVRDGSGRIWFARALSTGEAYRIPLGKGLSADISDPGALDLYVGGQFRGTLTTLQTPLDKVAGAFGAAAPPAAGPATPPTR